MLRYYLWKLNMRNELEIKQKIIETLYSAGCDEAGAY